jgi:hypothetical protein
MNKSDGGKNIILTGLSKWKFVFAKTLLLFAVCIVLGSASISPAIHSFSLIQINKAENVYWIRN